MGDDCTSYACEWPILGLGLGIGGGGGGKGERGKGILMELLGALVVYPRFSCEACCVMSMALE